MNENNYKDIVAKILIDIGSIKFSFAEPFTLTSGEKSPVYVDCRKLISFVKERNIIIDLAVKYINKHNLNFDIIAGGETAGIPYATFLSEKMQNKLIYVRKKPKGFGKNKQLEGHFDKGEKTILIEDLATDGGSKIIFIEAIRQAGLEITDILVIFFYNIFDLKKTKIGKMNVNIHSLCTWEDIIKVISVNKLIDEKNIDSLKLFLKDPEAWRQNNA